MRTLLRKLLGRENGSALKAEDAIRHAHESIPAPPGVRVREYDPPADVYWPSWSAWRFGQGSPELVSLRDVGQQSSHAITTIPTAWPTCAGHAGVIDSVRLPGAPTLRDSVPSRR